MAAVTLGSLSVGSTVKLKVDGTLQDFIIVHQGKPSDIYDNSCNGTWLVMKNPLETHRWHSSDLNDYANSEVHSYLKSTVLSKFDANIQAQIMQAKIPYRRGSGSSNNIYSGANGLSTKIFLLSMYEIGLKNESNNIPSDGAKLSYFEAGTGTSAMNKRRFNGSPWWTRSPYLGNSAGAWYIFYDGSVSFHDCSYTGNRIRPALILPSDLPTSSDGTVITNTAPTAPASITVPHDVIGGEPLRITWDAATDPDGNLAGYSLERQTDGGDWTEIYNGSDLSFTDAITRGWTSAAYRVRAYDSEGLYSDYRTSSQVAVINNRPPVITCAHPNETDIGEKDSPFSIGYSVEDPDGDAVTVTEAIDGVTQREYQPEAEAGSSFSVGMEDFARLSNGAHTMTISASDGEETATHTLRFTKAVDGVSVTLEQPMASEDPITVCILSVSGDIPEDAEYTAEVTNNANDAHPVWEDCTARVKHGGNHAFANQSAEQGFAFNFRVSIKRGPSGVGGYIDCVRGGFQ